VSGRWPCVPLRAVITEAQTGPFGSQLHSDEYIEGGIPVINPSNIVEGKFLSNRAVTVDEQTAGRLSRHRLELGDLVFARRGELGRAAVVTEEADGWLCGTGSLRVRLRPAALDPRFAGYVLQSAATRSYFEMAAVGSTMDNLNTAIVVGLPIPLPAMEDQMRTADLLDDETARIDALVAKKRRLIELCELKLAVEAAERTRDSVRVIPLRRLVECVQTGATPQEDLRDLESGNDDIEWLSPIDFNATLTIRPAARRLPRSTVGRGSMPIFPAGSAVVIGIGATAGRVGYLDRPVTGNQQLTCITPAKDVDGKFFAWQLLGRSSQMRKTAPYTTLPILNNDFLRSLEMTWPSLENQRRVARQLDERALRVCQALQALSRQVDLLHEHRQALITAAVTGELNIPAKQAG
jgi:type I restriction enzyme S subunit